MALHVAGDQWLRKEKSDFSEKVKKVQQQLLSQKRQLMQAQEDLRGTLKVDLMQIMR